MERGNQPPVLNHQDDRSLIPKEEHMLRNVKDLRGYAICGTDGLIGTVDDVYFDDEDWGIRYLVVNTGTGCPAGKC